MLCCTRLSDAYISISLSRKKNHNNEKRSFIELATFVAYMQVWEFLRNSKRILSSPVLAISRDFAEFLAVIRNQGAERAPEEVFIAVCFVDVDGIRLVEDHNAVCAECADFTMSLELNLGFSGYEVVAIECYFCTILLA